MNWKQATSHYLNQCWPISLTHICSTRRRSVKLFYQHHDSHLNFGQYLHWCRVLSGRSHRSKWPVKQHKNLTHCCWVTSVNWAYFVPCHYLNQWWLNLLIGALETNFNGILIKIQQVSHTHKNDLKLKSGFPRGREIGKRYGIQFWQLKAGKRSGISRSGREMSIGSGK